MSNILVPKIRQRVRLCVVKWTGGTSPCPPLSNGLLSNYSRGGGDDKDKISVNQKGEGSFQAQTSPDQGKMEAKTRARADLWYEPGSKAS